METVDQDLTARFEANRARLQALGYRILGSSAEAEDAVQETWLRLGTAGDSIENLGGWLTTVVTRVCLDRLRARRSRPELADDPDLDVIDDRDPADQAEMADSVGAALLVVLDVLPPAERVAFVLHDVFAVPFDEIAQILERSPDSARQLASRARRRVQGSGATGGVDLVRQREVVDAFLRAAQGGDFDELLRVLHPDVELRPDAAALNMGSLRRMQGADAVAGALAGGARSARRALVDGVAALAWAPGGQVRGVIEFTVRDGRIVALDVTGDEERLRQLDLVLLDD
jgi:RNA polymerase sigma-70 factor (ECF subfamily)